MLSITGIHSRTTNGTTDLAALRALLRSVAKKLTKDQSHDIDPILEEAVFRLRRIEMTSSAGRPGSDKAVERPLPHMRRREPLQARSVTSQMIQSQEEERKRLSRELHDDIGQRLSLAASTAALLAAQSGNGKLAQRLGTLRNDLDDLCSDVHLMSHNLHSHRLELLGVQSALIELGVRMGPAMVNIKINVDDLCEPRSSEVSLCLYRIAQEALNNAIKHSQARDIALVATSWKDIVYMTIQDSGIGFDTRLERQGLGIVSMGERLKLVGGVLQYQSIVGRGTELWITIPDTARHAGQANRNGDRKLRSTIVA